MYFLFAIPLLGLGYLIFLFFWYEWRHKDIPGPRAYPILGNVLNFASPKQIVERLLAYSDKYNGDFKVYLGIEPLIFLSNPKSLEVVLSSTTNLTKSKQYSYFKSWLGNGLLLSDGDYWHRHRKIITPAFHFQILDKYVRSFNSAADILIACLEKYVNKAAFDVYPHITQCTLDVMCESAMGVSVDAQINLESEYVTNVAKIGRVFMDRAFSLLQSDLTFKLTKGYVLEKEAVKVLRRYSYDVIDKKKIENKNIQSEGELTAKKKFAFLDLLLHHGTKTGLLTDDEVREEVDTLLFEGHHTTAAGLSFTLYCLANHPDVQDEAYKEIMSILTNDITKVPTIQDLQNMKYLEMIIKESLRLYPPVPFYGRKLTTDLKCGDGILLRKGSNIGIFAMGVHHDPKLFPDPYVFNPNRFSSENRKGQNPYAYLPFSAGPRNCIGQKFAMLELKSTISKVLRHYKLLPSPLGHKLELVVETGLRSASGIPIAIEKRE